jgi:hypothetical protein
MSIFFDLFPEDRRHLIGTLSGNSIINEMSSDELHDMIIECLTGRNPRIHTESWAQAKVFHGVFTGIQKMFCEGKKNNPQFILDAPKVASKYLYNHRTSAKKKPSSDRLTKIDITLCQWLCNLTGKGWDNILQANPENLEDWANSVLTSIQGVPYGCIEQNIVNMVIYNASLAKKGGLKSAMGNLFEPLLLYSGLSACGLKYEPIDSFNTMDGPCFTLNINEGRQADAQIKTGLTYPPKINIDIGFIGKGNPEIIADKTQRFSTISSAGQKPLDHTIIIVSAIPIEAQLVVRQARLLGAEVITMSGNNWVNELCQHLHQIGLSGLSKIPEEIYEAREMLKIHLESSKDIIQSVPKNLNIPTHWI